MQHSLRTSKVRNTPLPSWVIQIPNEATITYEVLTVNIICEKNTSIYHDCNMSSNRVLTISTKALLSIFNVHILTVEFSSCTCELLWEGFGYFDD